MSKRIILLLLCIIMVVAVESGSLAQKKVFEGQTINIATYAGGVHGAISGALYYTRDEWQKLTGATVNIVEIPFPMMYEKIFADLRTGAGGYDGFVLSSFFYGDLIANKFIVPIDNYMKDPKFPKWDPKDTNPATRNLIQWGGHYYGCPLDCDAEILYYRKDLFTDSSYQAAFKEKYNYDLPNPPETWEQALDCARFFNGKDLNGDGEPDYGFVTLFSGIEAGMWFLTLAGAYVEMPGPTVDRYHNVVLFDPETMEPLIKEPGFTKALGMYKEFYKSAPKAALGWGLTEQWDLFLRGRLALSYNCGDLGTLIEDPDRSEIKGKMLCAPVPGTYEVWDREKQKWTKLEKPNKIGNIHGASWHGVISQYAKNKEATYHFFSYLASKKVNFPITVMCWTGIDPGMIFDFPPEASNGHGTASLDDYLEFDVDKDDMLQYLSAYWKNYYEMDAWIPYNRLPGASEMLNSFEIHLAEFLSDTKTAEETQEAIYQDLKRVV